MIPKSEIRRAMLRTSILFEIDTILPDPKVVGEEAAREAERKAIHEAIERIKARRKAAREQRKER